jgi:DNA-binding SARP family transcriptional activator/tetratricopeptide (TPR) repeat protein
MGAVMRSPSAPTPRTTTAATVGRLLLGGAGQYQARAGTAVDLEPKDALLLAYLALEGPTPRGRLAALLWPEVDDERARGNLRQRLLRLKRSAGTELVTGQPQATLAAGLTHDLDATHELLQAVDAAQAGALAEWLEAQRQRRLHARMERLDAACTQAEAAGDLAAALAQAHAMVALDPLSEHAHRRVMTLHYLRGDTAAAIGAHERCRQVLAAELGVQPDEATRRLRAQIESGALAQHRRASGTMPVTLLRPPRLIGREAELAALDGAWAAAGVALVSGEPGVGKTRLLEDFVAGRPGALLVCCRPTDADMPLALVARLVQQTVTRHGAAASCAAHARLASMLPGFMAAEPEAAAPPARAPLAASMAELLASAEGLQAVVIDDLQFADQASIELLFELVAGTARLDLRWAFAVRTALDGATSERLSRVVEGLRATVVALEPLDAGALAEFVDSLGLECSEPAAVAARLHRRIGGNPLFALEALRLTHGRPDELAVLPPRVAELMDRRLNALSPAALALIRIAAVAGNEFSIELAEAVGAQDALALASPWRELETAQMLVGSAFSHDLVHETALRSLPTAIAQRLHARVADFLEQRAAEPARIARHRLAAGQDAAAVPQLVAAGRLAWAAARAQDIADFFLRAAEIEIRAGRGDAAFDILFDAADALSDTAGAALYDRAVEMARPLARSAGQLARLRLLDAVSAYLHGEFTRFVQLNDEALLEGIGAGELRVEAEARHGKGVVAVQQGRLQEGIEHLSAAARLMRDGGAPRRAAAMQSQLAAALTMAGQPRLAQQTQQEALPRLVQAQSQGDVARALAANVASALALGDGESVLQEAALALAAMRRADVADFNRVSIGRTLAGAYRQLGRLGQALAVLEEAAAGSSRPDQAEASLGDERARLFCELGRPELARRALDARAAGTDGAQRDRLRTGLASAVLQMALQHDPLPVLDAIDPSGIEDLFIAWDWLTLRGRARGTMRTLQQCDALLERCSRAGAHGLLPGLQALRAKLCADLGRTEQAADAASDAAARLAATPTGLLLPLRAWWLCSALESAGRTESARRCALAACDALRAAAHAHVPPEFADSFLQRNPLHRDLLALAARRVA